MCVWLKEEGFLPPMLFVQGPNGSPTTNVWEMDGLLRDTWERQRILPAPTMWAYGRQLHGL